MNIAHVLRNFFGGESTIDLKIPPSVETSDNLVNFLDFHQRIACDFIARTFSQITIRFSKNGKTLKDRNFIKWNSRPNQNESGAEFKYHLAYTLALNGECLVIVNSHNDLLIADDYGRIEHANTADEFQNVLVKDCTYGKTFRNGYDCFFFKVRAEAQDLLRDTIFNAYGKVIAHEFNSYLDSYGHVVKLHLDSTLTTNDENKEKITSFVESQGKALYKGHKTILLEQSGMEFSDFYAIGSTVSEEQISKVKDICQNIVCEIYNIPMVLLSGGSVPNVDQAKQMMQFINTCFSGFCSIIASTISFSAFDSYDEICEIEPCEILHHDIINDAANIDKAISCGAFTINEIRALYNYAPAASPLGDSHILTKNYEGNDMKGDDNQNEESEES